MQPSLPKYSPLGSFLKENWRISPFLGNPLAAFCNLFVTFLCVNLSLATFGPFQTTLARNKYWISLKRPWITLDHELWEISAAARMIIAFVVPHMSSTFTFVVITYNFSGSCILFHICIFSHTLLCPLLIVFTNCIFLGSCTLSMATLGGILLRVFWFRVLRRDGTYPPLIFFQRPLPCVHRCN